MDKGNELLQIMSKAEGNDDKTIQSLNQEISKKTQENLELREKITELNKELQKLKEIIEKNNITNPFEKAGGSDDEDNKERISIRNRLSSEDVCIFDIFNIYEGNFKIINKITILFNLNI